MIYKNITLALVSVFLLLTSCKEKSVLNETHYKFSFSDYNQQLPLESIFESVEVIPLDSRNAPIIGKIGKVMLKNDLFFIQDILTHTISSFDTQGNYIRTLDKRGKGQGEYLQINDFDLNDFDNTIDVMFKTGVVYQYSHDGQFFGQYILPPEIKAVHNFINISKDIVVFYNSTTDYRLFYFSRSRNDIIRKEFKQPITYIIRSGSPFTRINEKISFYEGFSNKRYIIDSKGIYDYYSIDLDEYNLDYNDVILYGYEKLMNDLTSRSLNKAYPFATTENNEFSVTDIRIADSRFHLLINKKNGSQTGLKTLSNDCLFPVDANLLQGNELIKIVPAFQLGEYIKPILTSVINLPTVENLHENDNPVILKYKLKEHF